MSGWEWGGEGEPPEAASSAPSGLVVPPAITHGLRRGLRSYAPSELEVAVRFGTLGLISG
jgi:hypothetical protein